MFSTYMTRYLGAWTILGIDTAVSTAVSAVSVAIISLWLSWFDAPGAFPLAYILAALVASVIGLLLLRVHHNSIRHTSLPQVGALIGGVIVKEGILVGAAFVLTALQPLTTMSCMPLVLLLAIDMALTLASLIVVRVLMVFIYDRLRPVTQVRHRKRVAVWGTDDKSVSLVKRLGGSDRFHVVGFLTDRPYGSLNLAGLPVHTIGPELGPDEVTSWLKERCINGVVFVEDVAARSVDAQLVQPCLQSEIGIYMSPPIDQMQSSTDLRSAVRHISIEDLLGRDEILISMDQIMREMRDKTVMVTGAAGSIGSELCRQLAGFGIRRLVMFDNAETPMHTVRLEFEERWPSLDFVPVIGDVRHPNRLDFVFRTYHPQIVFHAAAYKHVPLMEENPCEAVLVNVAGTRNVADKCIAYGAEKMVMISTDKAVNPTNIMGCTKRLAEIYVQSLGTALAEGKKQGKTKFVTTRFGNVLGSNGSVIPRFREQIAKGGPVTVTHPEITRFFMTIPEASRLVMEAATMTTGNQIFVFDMGQPVKIADLARRMIQLAGLRPDKDIALQYIGLRPGEKLYEEVLSDHENTDPTSHDRIRVARVRQYGYEDALEVSRQLEQLAMAVKIQDTVKLMKKTVPEYISRNSEFEKLDRHRVN